MLSEFFEMLRSKTPSAPPSPSPNLNLRQVGKTAFAVLKLTLATLGDLADGVPVPGLKVAVAGIASIVATVEVSNR